MDPCAPVPFRLICPASSSRGSDQMHLAYMAPASHTDLVAYIERGQPDVVLRLEGGGDLPAHSDVLKAYSKVLREVTCTTRTLPICNTGSDKTAEPSVIPLGVGDSLCWAQSLTAMYCFVDGATDEETWETILVRAHMNAFSRDLHTLSLRYMIFSEKTGCCLMENVSCNTFFNTHEMRCRSKCHCHVQCTVPQRISSFGVPLPCQAQKGSASSEISMLEVSQMIDITCVPFVAVFIVNLTSPNRKSFFFFKSPQSP